MLKFRAATEADFGTLATLTTTARMNDPMYLAAFQPYFSTQSRYFQFIARLQCIQMHNVLKKGFCLVGELNQHIISAVIIDSGPQKAFPLWWYLRAGAFNLFPELLRGSIINTLHQLQLAQAKLTQRATNRTWSINLIATNPMYTSMNLEQTLITEGLIPELKRMYAEKLILTTTNDRDCFLFQKAHFRISKHIKLRFKWQRIETWQLKLNL